MTKLLIYSDLHNERLRFQMPHDIDFDVLVAAGDIDDEPERAVDFLASSNKPVVWVAGNHDLWSEVRKSGLPHVDFHARLTRIRALIKGTQVHLLEQSSVVIGDTRFLGTTLWTNFFRGDKRMMHSVHRSMNDYLNIGAQEWLAHPEVREEFIQECKKCDFDIDDTDWNVVRFHPVLAYLWYQQAENWLLDKLPVTGDWKKNVVVTHHAPTYLSLVKTGVIKEESLNPSMWPDRPGTRQPTHDMLRIGGYASDLEQLLGWHRNRIDLWIHGHIHRSVDVAASGVRVVANPRGYAFGKDDLQAGDNHSFDPRFVVDLETHRGYMDPLMAEIDEAILKLEDIFDELAKIGEHVKHRNPVVRQAIIDSFDARRAQFSEVGSRICNRIRSNIQHDGSADSLDFRALYIYASPFLPGLDSSGSTAGKVAVKTTSALARQFIDTLKQVPELQGRVVSARAKVARMLGTAIRKAHVEAKLLPTEPWESDTDLQFEVPTDALSEKRHAELRKLAHDLLRKHNLRNWQVSFVSPAAAGLDEEAKKTVAVVVPDEEAAHQAGERPSRVVT